MRQIRRIVVGIDLAPEGGGVSEGSRTAAEHAVDHARRTGASVELLHSTHLDDFEDDPRSWSGSDDGGRSTVEEFAGGLNADGVDLQVAFTDERPWLALVQRACDGKADLLAVGRRNAASPDLLPIGSVSRHLLRQSPAPVWVVRPDQHESLQRVLAATDLSPVGDRVIELAASFAKTYEAALEVLHAYQTPFELQMRHARMGNEAFQAELGEIAGKAESHIRAELERVGATGTPFVHVLRDAASRAVLGEVARQRVDLLVLGTLSRSGVPGLLIGNTAEKLLDRVPCSLLTVKPEGFTPPGVEH